MQQAEQKLKLANARPVITVDQAKVVSVAEETGTFGLRLDEYDRKHWNNDMDTPLVKKAKAYARPLPDISNITGGGNAEYQRT